ncbi:uncharacterized protein LOC133388035 [Rhineura floridana]|uniref:uncharacterized protein LOC133388035 n=1 Tax=Rhineura floridana TaxID=261503 RepID=UPI002AC84499|nr:uncharacterized protein LOC133388035 [Rhineura floridana]XP_061490085.1 uncharacterized protein LOC133388035 [Rhineura floridana]XP_061490086.1 uncharacterized protein LOC133388035 [Rhineura floridana]
MLLVNARSVNGKTAIQDLILDEHADLACIMETWLDEAGGVNLSQLSPPGFSVQQQARPGGWGGRVAVIYRDTISLTRCPLPQSSGFECVYLKLGGRDRIGILLVYHPPRCSTVSLPELAGVVSGLVLESPRLVVLGDFNIHAETALSGVAQDFMASMTTMGLSQVLSGPTHAAGHTLDLVFCAGWDDGDLGVEELSVVPLSWTDHYLVGFRLTGTQNLCRGGGPIRMVRPRRLMDPDGFLMALGDFPVTSAGDSVEALVDLWNGEMARAVDTIAPERPLSWSGAKPAPWFTRELAAMKRIRLGLERCWRKTRNESAQTRARAYLKAYSVAVRVKKKLFFSATIVSARSRPAELFRVVRGLLHSGPQEGNIDHSTARCQEFARHFADKVAQIRSDLDAKIDSLKGCNFGSCLSNNAFFSICTARGCGQDPWRGESHHMFARPLPFLAH